MDSTLFNQDSFYRVFMKDITGARRRVIIESPFIATRRLRQILPVLAKLVRHGVKVIVNTKPLNEHDGLLYDMAEEGVRALQACGVTVLMTVGHHRKLAIVDDAILWEGSLNILSQNNSCEIMRRISSEIITLQTVNYLSLDRFYGLE